MGYQKYPQSAFFRIRTDRCITNPFKVPHKDSVVPHHTKFMLSAAEIAATKTPTDSDWKVEYHLFVLYHTQPDIGVKNPAQVTYAINSKSVTLSTVGDAVNFGYDVTDYCKEGTNDLVVIASGCCCAYLFAIREVLSRNLETIVDTVKQRTISFQEGLTRVKNSFSNNDDIAQLHITVGLLCPLGQTFIETPVKSKQCAHVQCFDLESFLLFNKNSTQWECPICGNDASTDNLVVDEYMKSILEDIGSDDNGESVKIAEDGSWEVFEIEFGDHSESEDEDEDDDTTLLKKRSVLSNRESEPSRKKLMRVIAPPKPDIIDLTL